MHVVVGIAGGTTTVAVVLRPRCCRSLPGASSAALPAAVHSVSASSRVDMQGSCPRCGKPPARPRSSPMARMSVAVQAFTGSKMRGSWPTTNQISSQSSVIADLLLLAGRAESQLRLEPSLHSVSGLSSLDGRRGAQLATRYAPGRASPTPRARDGVAPMRGRAGGSASAVGPSASITTPGSSLSWHSRSYSRLVCPVANSDSSEELRRIEARHAAGDADRRL